MGFADLVRTENKASVDAVRETFDVNPGPGFADLVRQQSEASVGGV